MRLNPIVSSLRTLDRQGQRMFLRQYEKDRMRRPERFVEMDTQDVMREEGMLKAFVSREFMVQVWQKPDAPLRLSIHRTKINDDGSWVDGITWDDLYRIKNEVGYGDYDCLEVYPRQGNIVNIANIRHLWVWPEPLKFSL